MTNGIGWWRIMTLLVVGGVRYYMNAIDLYVLHLVILTVAL